MTKNKLEKGIIEELPQIPYVIDQVGEALKWAKEELDEGEYNQILKIAFEVVKYTKEKSDPNFFKTHLVLASILFNIPDATKKERFEKFDTASKATEKALNELCINPDEINEKGCFKALLIHLVPLAKKDEHLFAVSLIGMKNDLLEIVEGNKATKVKTPITSKDYITMLGYAFVMANLRMANLNLLNTTYEIFNDIEILLNSLSY